MPFHLSEAAIRQIAKLVSERVQDQEIAEMFGVTPNAIQQIRTGKTHSDLTGVSYSPTRPVTKRAYRLTDQEKAKALRLASTGRSSAEVHRLMTLRNPEVGYDSVSSLIRKVRSVGGLPPAKHRAGRPIGSKGERKSVLTPEQIQGLASAGAPEAIKRKRQTNREIKALVRYILANANVPRI